MKIIQNLLELLIEDTSNYDDSMLLEAIGNLNVIDKKFLNVLKSRKLTTSAQTGRKGLEKRQSLTKGVGDKSPFTTKNFPSGGPAMTAFADDINARAMVLVTDEGAAGGYQVMIVAKAFSSKSDHFDFGIDYSFLSTALKPSMEEVEALEALKAGGSYISGAVAGISSFTDVKQLEIGKIMNVVLKMFKARGLKFQFTVISTDTDRSQKNAARVETRKGIIPKYRSAEAIERYEALLRRDLRARLDKFKSGKSEKYETPEALIKGILEQGYLDKFTFAGQTYDIFNDRINFRELRRTGEKRYESDESYIEYKVNEKTDAYKAEVKRIEETYEAIRAEASANNTNMLDAEYNAKYKELMKDSPPKTIKIILELKGGSIVPKDIKYENGLYY